jgi:uncharacterized protein (DUF2252 family)
MSKSNPEEKRHSPHPAQKGKRKVPATWNPELRKQDPFALLDKAMEGRLKSLLPLKNKRMSVSPFSFFRGAVPIMAYDLSLNAHSGELTQLCGDAHVQNLGAYAGIDGRLIFDINDFDETVVGPFEWDVKRMATSILLAGRDAKLEKACCRKAVRAFVGAYCGLMGSLAALPVLQAARYQVRRLKVTPAIERILTQAERATPERLLDRLTRKESEGRRFRSQPPELEPLKKDEQASVLASLDAYRSSLLPERRHFFNQYRPIDVAFKVVGTGSVGLRDYCVYMEGNGPGDPLFLQIKQEVQSAYAPYLGGTPKTITNGQRVADGQRAMQLQSDPLLGWTSFGGHDYLVRQLNDHKASLDITTMGESGLREYAIVCGEMLARGHARSGNAKAIHAYCGAANAFEDEILSYGVAYAKQTIADWKQFVSRQRHAA